MSTGAATWLAISGAVYLMLGGRVRQRSTRLVLALAWPLGVVAYVLLPALEEIRKTVSRL